MSATASRKQALNACEACRQRKTKCDEDKPSCSRCMRIGLACSYAETVAFKKNIPIAELTDTLKRIDERLETISSYITDSQNGRQKSRPQSQAALSQTSTQATASHHGPVLSPGIAHSISPATPGQQHSVSSPPVMDSAGIKEELSLSRRHLTAPQYILTWPCSEFHLSGIQLQYPVQLEIQVPRMSTSIAPPACLRSAKTGSSWISDLSMSQMSQLTKLYFSHFHPPYQILDETHFYRENLNQAVRSNFDGTMDTCIVLLVCALGAIACHYTGNGDWSQDSEDEVGLGFFNLAMSIFQEVNRPTWTSVQCLLLASMFHASKLRTYDAWCAINQACGIILILIPLSVFAQDSSKKRNFELKKALLVRQIRLEPFQCRLYWTAYLHESQVLAEFDFPPSGIGKLASTIHLPVTPDEGTDPSHATYQLFFLALITSRKLLNRILYHVYSRDTDDESCIGPSVDHLRSFLPSRSVMEELDRQLEEWRACLPEGLQFEAYSPHHEYKGLEPFEHRPINERLRTYLMGRYFSAKHVLHRPFVFKALECIQPSLLTDEDKVGARVCLECGVHSTIAGGLLYEPTALLLHPINLWRAHFALEAELLLTLKNPACRFALPKNWDMVLEIRRRIGPEVARLSATVARDGEVLESLA